MRAVQQLFDLTGKTALVTGGSRGLGLQIAEALGEQGARVVVTSRKQADLDEAVAHLTEKGIHASSISSNLSDEASITPLVDDVLALIGEPGPDIPDVHQLTVAGVGGQQQRAEHVRVAGGR